MVGIDRFAIVPVLRVREGGGSADATTAGGAGVASRRAMSGHPPG